MFVLRRIFALALFAALCAPSAAPAASGSMMPGGMMPEVTNAASRFSGPGVYTGKPALQVTLSMIMAGGGPSDFKSVTLLKTLAGDKFDAEVGKLTNQYGKEKIANFLKVFNFVVTDSLRIVKEEHVALPSSPSPDPHDGPALAKALWSAGQTGNGFNVEVMLDRAVSHPIHVQVMRDIDSKYGIAADADYHAILTTAMHDLAAVYGLH
ncbi:MAG TPA: hypothetical protein VFE17_08435 [Candidatus Baltobacteraceae bacterium]|jgi:hypothetical protein|nr:hypothetical protein [Candidatus Baltobacteraceae bacterium]